MTRRFAVLDHYYAGTVARPGGALISYKNAEQYEALLLSFWASDHGGDGIAVAASVS